MYNCITVICLCSQRDILDSFSDRLSLSNTDANRITANIEH